MPRAYGFTDYGGPEMQEFLDVPKSTPGQASLCGLRRLALSANTPSR